MKNFITLIVVIMWGYSNYIVTVQSTNNIRDKQIILEEKLDRIINDKHTVSYTNDNCNFMGLH